MTEIVDETSALIFVMFLLCIEEVVSSFVMEEKQHGNTLGK